MNTTATTIEDFIRVERLSMTCERTDSNPNMLDSASMDHWRCKISRRLPNNRTWSLTVPFSMGYGHNGKEPKLLEVLDSLASDITDQTFEDWCDDMGFDVDSRKAERTYKIVQRQTTRLVRFLGEEGVAQLQQCERL